MDWVQSCSAEDPSPDTCRITRQTLGVHIVPLLHVYTGLCLVFCFPRQYSHCRHCPNQYVNQDSSDVHDDAIPMLVCRIHFCLHKCIWYITCAHIPTFLSIDYWCDKCRFCADSRTWYIFPVNPLSLWFAISAAPCLFFCLFFSTRRSRDSIALWFSDVVTSLMLIGLKHCWSCSCFISLNAASAFVSKLLDASL